MNETHERWDDIEQERQEFIRQWKASLLERSRKELSRLGLGEKESNARDAIITRAISSVGEVENGNNQGPFVQRVTKGKEGVAWCSYFILYCLEAMGKEFPEADYRKLSRVSSLANAAKEEGLLYPWKRLSEGQEPHPRPGDILLFAQPANNLDNVSGHAAIVLWPVYEHGILQGIRTVEGNVSLREIFFAKEGVQDVYRTMWTLEEKKALGYAKPFFRALSA